MGGGPSRRASPGSRLRVHFSGAGPLAPDPALRLDRCGLPERMAVEIAARALLSWVRVTARREGAWVEGTLVPRELSERRCRALSEAGRTPPSGELTIRGLACRRREKGARRR